MTELYEHVGQLGDDEEQRQQAKARRKDELGVNSTTIKEAAKTAGMSHNAAKGIVRLYQKNGHRIKLGWERAGRRKRLDAIKEKLLDQSQLLAWRRCGTAKRAQEISSTARFGFINVSRWTLSRWYRANGIRYRRQPYKIKTTRSMAQLLEE